MIVDLTVNYNADDREQTLSYEPRRRGDNFSPEYPVSVGKQQLRAAVQKIESRVEYLLRLACNEQPRNDVGIEEDAEILAKLIFGERGFVSIVPPAAQPCFRTYRDEAAAIPWETLEEYYGECRTPGCKSQGIARFVSHRPTARKFCPDCGDPLQMEGGKLSIHRHLTHHVRGGDRLKWDGGKEFLLVVDPTENLCRVPPNVSDPREKKWARECREHVTQVARSLESAGYRPTRLSGRAATKSRLLEKMREPAVVGLYFFGHGQFPKGGGPGHLRLAPPPSGGDEADAVLSAQEIEQASPLLRFVFLNACEGAAVSNGWAPGMKSSSVGEAFARGHRIVVAPMWSTFKVHAARAAVDFFTRAAGGLPLTEALRSAREQSLARYQAGEPDISWMTYRYLGPENLALPRPESRLPDVPEQPQCSARLFLEDGRIDTQLFGFGMESVLFRAGKRRYLRGRRKVTISDLIAGLCRRGGLTRLLLSELGLQPDAIYDNLLKLHDTAPASADQEEQHNRRREEFKRALKTLTRREEPAEGMPVTDEQRLGGTWLPGQPTGETNGESTAKQPEADRSDDELQALIARCDATCREDLAPAACSILKAADEQAQQHGDDRTAPISEFDVLKELVTTGAWPAIPDVLPPAEEFARVLQGGRWREEVDENASLKLDDLSEPARKIVRTAHELSQQRGRFPLSNRLMLASFFIDGDSEASRLVESSYSPLKAKDLGDILIDAAKAVGSGSYPLTHEAARGSLLPALKRARELMREGNGSATSGISEQQLFAAYCETAPSILKNALIELRPPYRIDLDVLAQLARGERPANRKSLPSAPVVPAPENTGAVASLSTNQSPPRIYSARPLTADDQNLIINPGDAHLGYACAEESDFEPACWKVILIACEWACLQGSSETLPAHLLAAMLQDPQSRAAGAVLKAGFELDAYKRRILLSILPQISGNGGPPSFSLSTECLNILTAARRRGEAAGRSRAGVDDLLVELLAVGNQLVEKVLMRDAIAFSPPGTE